MNNREQTTQGDNQSKTPLESNLRNDKFNKIYILIICAVLLIIFAGIIIGFLSHRQKTDVEDNISDSATENPDDSNDPNGSDEPDNIDHTHIYGDWFSVKEPTCTEKGLYERLCSCGKSESMEKEATGHAFGDWYIAIKPTYMREGREDKKCVCGLTESRVVYANDVFDGFVYVSSKAALDGEGSSSNPFSTISQARDALREIDKSIFKSIVVYVEVGEYDVDSLVFNKEDGGNADCPIIYRSVGGEVLINGGVSLDPGDFSPASNYPEIYNRLPLNAKDKVLVLDISKPPYNLNQNEYGRIYPIGTYNTASGYKGDTTGPMYCELFVNYERQNLARYPDSDYIYTDEVLFSGRNSGLTDANGDPLGDIYIINSDLAQRISTWQNLNDVWAFGFWQYDWADGSSPIKGFDASTRELSMKYYSFFGARSGAPYYFYNCLEELSCEGEWYLDRESGLVCVYASEDFVDSKITLSLSTSPVMQINANYMFFEGFTVTGSRGDGILVNGDGVKIENCLVKSVGGCGILANGNNVSILSSEVSYTGRGGIAISGGDRRTLKSSENVVSNNLVHDWSQIYKTYQAGISLYGTEIVCSHNELYNSPHLAITYSGNNNIVEYNLIHDVCLESDDAGAIYAGRSWSSYGNHVRYNCIYDIGASGHSPDGIYMDDALSGQYIYGNILVNIPKYGIHIGGGRDMKVWGNLIINAGEYALRYDARARLGVLGETWFSDHVREGSGDLWLDLYDSPWKSEIWLKTYPEYSNMSGDFSNIDDPNFISNPAGSVIEKNIVFSTFSSLGHIDDDVYKYSSIGNNKKYFSFMHDYMFGSVNSNEYALKYGNFLKNMVEELKGIPFETIGRIS